MTSLLEISDATIATPGDRILFDGLNLRLGREHVALMGRNGVGKSTLLAVLAGSVDALRGGVRSRGRTHFVPQSLDARAIRRAYDRAPREARAVMAEEWLAMNETPLADIVRAPALSLGELRKLALLLAKQSGADVVLLDEPTEDLDDVSVAWLRKWLGEWRGAVIAASHDARLLEDFEHFFIASETGCRVFSGSLPELDALLLCEHDEAEERYTRNLNRLVAYERHVLDVTRRRDRKKRFGRCRELDRATARIRLNTKRSQAQVYQGKFTVMRNERLAALRTWSKSTRRALDVSLPLDLAMPELPAESSDDLLALRGVSARSGDRVLFAPFDLRVGRQRIGVIGPNGAGKTTLLQIMLGNRKPVTGSVVRRPIAIGSIDQGGTAFALDESLLDRLELQAAGQSTESGPEILVAHKFPLALGQRPLASLSPGERVRAALIAIFRQSPPAELLILDEPTYSLDRVGRHAMIQALRTFRGGLVVASHDRPFLEAIGIDTWVALGSQRGTA